MRPSSALVQPARHGGRNAVRQAVARRRPVLCVEEDAMQRDLPSLRRSIHAGRTFHKPRSSLNQAYQRDAGRVYSLQTHLPGDLTHTYIPDPTHILAEWRLLERQALERLTEKDKVKDAVVVDDVRAGVKDEDRDAGNFFTPSYHTEMKQRTETHSIDAEPEASTFTPLKSASKSLSTADVKTSYSETLWVETLDPKSMAKAMTLTMSEIRNGQRDMNELLRIALDVLGRDGITQENCDTCFEQMRIGILSYWLAIVRRGLESNSEHVKVQTLLLQVTETLYRSSIHYHQPSQRHSPALMAIQRAALHRIGASVLAHTDSQSASLISVAMRLTALILRDVRLKGSQARFMARRVVRAFEAEAEARKTSVPLSSYKEMSTSLVALMRRGILPDLGQQSFGSSKEIIVRFLKVCSSEANRWQAEGCDIFEGSKSVIEDAYIPLALELSKPRASNANKAESVTDVVSLLSKSDFTMLIETMVQNEHFADARRVYMHASAKVRTFEGACYLMPRWSDTPLRLSRGSTLSSDTTSGAARKGFAADLLSAARDQLNYNDKAKVKRQLRLLASSRFSRHLRCADVHALIGDLDELACHWSTLPGQYDRLTRSGVLTCLGEKAQLSAVRTFARCNRLGHAVQLATRLARAQITSSLPTKLANALFVSSISSEPVGLNVGRRSVSHPSRSRLQPAKFTLTLHRRSSTQEKTRKMLRGLDVMQRFCKASNASLDHVSSIVLLRQMAYCRGKRLYGSTIRSLAQAVGWHSSGQPATTIIDEARYFVQVLTRASKEQQVEMVLRMTEQERQRYHAIESSLSMHSNRNHTTKTP